MQALNVETDVDYGGIDVYIQILQVTMKCYTITLIKADKYFNPLK